MHKPLLIVVGALLAGVGLARDAHAISACTAAQISANDSSCPSGTGPCTISKTFEIGNGCTLDFGTRAVTVTGKLDIGHGAVTVKAGSLTVAAGGKIEGIGDGSSSPNNLGGKIRIETTGIVNVQTGSPGGRILMSGRGTPGDIIIVAGGTVTIAGRAESERQEETAGGGNIDITSAVDVITTSASTMSVVGGLMNAGGTVSLTAGGRIDLGAKVDAHGGEGGIIIVTATGDAIVRDLECRANGDTGFGGSLDVTGANVQMLGIVTCDGSPATIDVGGGDGGDIVITAEYGNITVSRDVNVNGAGIDGSGGSIDYTARGAVTINTNASQLASGVGTDSGGGEISIDALSLTSGGILNASGGVIGGDIDVFTVRDATFNLRADATAFNFGGFGGAIFVEAGVEGQGNLNVNDRLEARGGDCSAEKGCGIGGSVELIACNLTIGTLGSISTRGASGGFTSLTAREQLTVRGAVDSTKTVTTGADGQNFFEHPSRKPPSVTATVSPPAQTTAFATCTSAGQQNCLDPCPVCGNGTVEFPETCDNNVGTPQSCDGCSTTCRIENCNDGNGCTSDTCTATLGCRNTPSAEGASCNDSNVCNGTDVCHSGACVHQNAPTCVDNNTCTTDGCNPSTGCTFTPTPGGPCSDGNACTVNDTCSAAAVCQPGAPRVCDDGRECTTDSCNTATGCVATNRTGSCTDDGSTCTTDVCNAGNCTHPASANGTTCSDGNACTTTDSCQSGTCQPGPTRNCNDSNTCTTDGCSPASGCTNTPTPGASCSDGNACTTGETCSGAGACQGGAPLVCDDGRECTTDSCNTATGCVATNRTGSCTDDGNTCTTDVCNAGNCTHPASANGTTCSDANACTTPDTCQGGACQPGPTQTCNDNNTCTTDACSPASGCSNTPTPGASCSDGNACTNGDTCGGAGTCQAGPPLVCDDGRECTTDTCNTATGCVATNRTGSCKDDGNTCTTDVCNAGDCTHPGSPNGTTCSDSNACTTPDTCQGGTCQPGPTQTCNDNNTCTTDGCSPSTGCSNTPTPGASCDDASFCTENDTCSGTGVCQGTTITCNDNEQCTTDTCVPATGCVFTNRPNGTGCDDGLFCNVGETCQAGTCTGGAARNCADTDTCTLDTCNESIDMCEHNAGPGSCCGNNVTDPGEDCDDGNTSNTDACLNTCRTASCGDGFVRTGVEECDLGAGNSDAPNSACRTNCRLQRCGDGIVDDGEQCDDGGVTPGDGCSERCFEEPPPTAALIAGKGKVTTDCALEWAYDRPALDRKGKPSTKQSCQDGDPSCDYGTTPGECLFHVWSCANNQDPNLPLCTPGSGGVGTVVSIEVRKPSEKDVLVRPADADNRAELVGAMPTIVNTGLNTCGPRMDIRVPRKAPTSKGSKTLKVRAFTASEQKDSDNLKLYCLP